MNPKPTFLLAALLAFAVAASADEFRYSFTGTIDNKYIITEGSDRLSAIDGPTDFTLSFTANYLNDGGTYTFRGISAITVSVADWLFADRGDCSRTDLTASGQSTDLFMQSDSLFEARSSTDAIACEGTEFWLYGLTGTQPGDFANFTGGTAQVWGYWFDSVRSNYAFTGTLSPVGEGGSVLVMLLAGLALLGAARSRLFLSRP